MLNIDLVVVTPVRLHREALSKLLSNHPEFASVRAAPDVSALVAAHVGQPPHAVLMDFQLAVGGSELRLLRQEFPGVKVLALGLAPSCQDGGTSTELDGLLPLDAGIDDVLGCLHEVELHGHSHQTEAVSWLLYPNPNDSFAQPVLGMDGDPLSRRQHEIAQLVAAGLSNKAIANRLDLSLHTVKNPVHAILQKLGACRRTEAAAILARLPRL